MRLAYGILFLFSATLVLAQAPPNPTPTPGAEDVTALAKQTQNPVGDSSPSPSSSTSTPTAPTSTRPSSTSTSNPSSPSTSPRSSTYIARTIVPVVSIPTGNGISYSGVGDIVEQTFFTPAHPGKVILGIGPSFSFPTATAYPAKTGTWAGGGSAVVLATPGPFVLGSLFVQLSPMTDSGGEPRVNNFLWQYFVNYNFGKGWALATAPSITANWDIHSGQQWTVPYGGGISRTLVFAGQPMSLGFQYYYAPVRPSTAASSTVRFNVVLIYPQRRGK